MADDRYDKIRFRGHVFDKMTAAAIETVEAKLGYELTIVQGSYNTKTSASAGTHDGGGAADLVPWHQADKVLACRQVGFAAWHRPAIPGVWGEHIHIVLLGNDQASPSAKNQWADYRAGRNGLANDGPDTGPRLDPIPMFHYRGFHVEPPPPPPPPGPPPVPWPAIQEIQQALGRAIRLADEFKDDHPNMKLFDRMLMEWREDWRELFLRNHPN